MAEIGNPQPEPNVGIRGNPQSLPVYKRTESQVAPTSIPNFVSTFNELATTPTALGQLSANLTASATNKLMDKWGYELGSNPSGNLLPSITNADKRFEVAYTNQAQATLGLHANQLMIQGQMELEKAYKLTPEMVQSYTANMAQGLDDILKQAPDNLRPLLQNEFSNSLLRSSAQLNTKMIGQQKQQYKEQMSVYNQTQTKNIYETAMAGQTEQAKVQLDSQVARNKQLREAGVISAVEEQNNNQTAKQTYLTGVYSQKAIAAKSQGKLEEYLAGLNNKPAGVSYLDWQAVGRNVLSNVGQIEALERRDQTLNASQFDLAIVENRVTSDVIEELREKQTPENFTRSMVKYVSHLNKIANTQKNTNELAANWGSPIAQADATTKDQNTTFQNLAVAYQQKQTNMGKPAVSEIEAKTVVANNAGAPIPQFTDELNNMLISANPDLMIQASNAYRVLGQLKAPISSQAKAMLFGFESQIQQGRTPEEAAAIVRENIAPKSQDELIAQDMVWNQYKKDHLVTFDDQVRHAKGLMDIPWRAEVPNLPALTIQVNKAFESNLKLLNGDVNAAKAMTQHNLEQSYGVTYVNGHKEYTYLPVENFMGVQDGAAGIIQNDVAEQAVRQVEATKSAFDNGHNDFYYRVKDRPSFTEAIEAKKEIDATLGGKSFGSLPEAEFIKAHEKVDELQKKVDSYTASNPIIVEKVWRGGHVESYELAIQASSNMGLGINAATPIAGGYDISLRTAGGKLTPMIGVDNLSNGNIVYRPNLDKLRTQYFAIHGVANPAQEYGRQQESLIGRKKFEEENGLNQGINALGRGFR